METPKIMKTMYVQAALFGLSRLYACMCVYMYVYKIIKEDMNLGDFCGRRGSGDHRRNWSGVNNTNTGYSCLRF